MPYGTEALGVMRIEKGHVAGGELNGQTTARDLGLGRMLSTKKDYIGRVMAQRPALTARTGRRWLASSPVDPAQTRVQPARISSRCGAGRDAWRTTRAT